MRVYLGAAFAVLIQLALIAPSAAGEAVRVTITNLAFSPAKIDVKAGDTVEWVNEDFIDHTATGQDDSWDVAIPAGKSARRQFAQAGSFAYYCRVHPGMTGTINVVAE
jgi:plastocyanin